LIVVREWWSVVYNQYLMITSSSFAKILLRLATEDKLFRGASGFDASLLWGYKSPNRFFVVLLNGTILGKKCVLI